jgi:hypothetical protein
VPEQQTINIIDNTDVTVTLIEHPLDWRVRVVEELVIDSATSCTRRRSLQAAPLRPLLDEFLPAESTHALLALNVAPMPRGPLFDFDLQGPCGDAWLLPRTEIAARERAYLTKLAKSCGEVVSPRLRSLLDAILGFTGEWFSNGFPQDLLSSYIEPGLGRLIDTGEWRRWQQISDGCWKVMLPRLDVFHRYSAPATPLLVAPELVASGIVTRDSEVTELLAEYRDLVIRVQQHAESEPDPGAAADFLNSLADYGNSYDLVAAMKVPLDSPFLVKFSERRDPDLSPWMNQGSQELVIADAQTNHVTLQINDPSVRITRFDAMRPGSNEQAAAAFQSRSDDQGRAFYEHEQDRDYRLRLVFRLALLPRLQIVPAAVTVVLLLMTAALWHQRPSDLGALALVAGPSALAASILLFREPSTLGSRLRRFSSGLLAGAFLLLLGTATLLYVLGSNVTGVL